MKSETSASKLWQRILLSHNMQISDTRTSICYICVCVFIVSAEMKAKPKAIAGTLFSLIAFRILLKRKRRKQSERDEERERQSEMCQQQPKCDIRKGADNEACVCLLVLLQSVLIAVSLWPLFHLIYVLVWVCAYVCVCAVTLAICRTHPTAIYICPN